MNSKEEKKCETSCTYLYVAHTFSQHELMVG